MNLQAYFIQIAEEENIVIEYFPLPHLRYVALLLYWPAEDVRQFTVQGLIEAGEVYIFDNSPYPVYDNYQWSVLHFGMRPVGNTVYYRIFERSADNMNGYRTDWRLSVLGNGRRIVHYYNTLFQLMDQVVDQEPVGLVAQPEQGPVGLGAQPEQGPVGLGAHLEGQGPGDLAAQDPFQMVTPAAVEPVGLVAQPEQGPVGLGAHLEGQGPGDLAAQDPYPAAVEPVGLVAQPEQGPVGLGAHLEEQGPGDLAAQDPYPAAVEPVGLVAQPEQGPVGLEAHLEEQGPVGLEAHLEEQGPGDLAAQDPYPAAVNEILASAAVGPDEIQNPILDPIPDVPYENIQLPPANAPFSPLNFEEWNLD